MLPELIDADTFLSVLLPQVGVPAGSGGCKLAIPGCRFMRCLQRTTRKPRAANPSRLHCNACFAKCRSSVKCIYVFRPAGLALDSEVLNSMAGF